MENRFFNRLVSVSLFQGLSTDDFMQIAERVHFDFRTISEGATIVREGEACERLICSLTGTVCKEERCDNGSYFFREYNALPTLFQPERLFGLRPRHTATFTAVSEVQIMSIPKQEVREILFQCVPFHINYLNHVCSVQHLWENRLWQAEPDTLEQKFLRFILLRSSRPAGHKELIIDMIALAQELSTTRLRVSHMLNTLAQTGMVELRRRHINIPSLEALLQHIQSL